MAFKDELVSEVAKFFEDIWTTRDGKIVPDPSDLKLSNDAVKISGTILYADINGSTSLVDTNTSEFAAEVYKSYLHCVARIVKSEGGVITSYDGDRIMAVYISHKKILMQ